MIGPVDDFGKVTVSMHYIVKYDMSRWITA